MSRMRFAAHILLFDCERLILRAIENIAPWVDRVFVAYSKRPWGYLPGARERFKNSTDPKILRTSAHWSKISLIEGDWLTEEGQRNACVERAREEGFDYLIIQDADEFFLAEEIQKNLDGIRAEPNWSYYRNPWYLFWKTCDWVLVHRRVVNYKGRKVISEAHNSVLNYCVCFAVNLRSDVRFAKHRLPHPLDDYSLLPGKCHHLSYVMSDEEMWRKINTWGHANEFDRELWYDVKWRGWTESSRNLSPMSPVSWRSAVRYEGVLPAEIVDFEPGLQEYRPPSMTTCVQSWIRDEAHAVRTVAGEWRSALRTSGRAESEPGALKGRRRQS